MAGNPVLDALTKPFMYHLKFAKIFDFGAQGQLRTGDTPQAFNGFGFSLQAAVLPGLKIGGAYNKTYFNPQFTQVVFNGGRTDYWTLGAKGDWRNLEWGAVWARQTNGDIAFVPDPAGGPESVAVGFSANGVEIYSRLKFGKFAAVLGFEDYIPHDLNPLINSDFKTQVRDPWRRMALLKIRLRVRSKRSWATRWMRRERCIARRGHRLPLRL